MRTVNVHDVRRRAKRRLPRIVFDFVDGGADDERTLRRNETSFGSLFFRPQVLRDVEHRSQRTTVLGQDVSSPVLLAPTGLARLTHPRGGEVEVARAAEAAETIFALSSGASCTMEDVAAATSSPMWLQLYLFSERDVVAELIERARAARYHALCVTVDVPVVGNRERDERNGLTVPPRPTAGNVLDLLRHPRWSIDCLRAPRITFANIRGRSGRYGDSATELATYVNEQLTIPSVSWADLGWVRREWEGPLVIKGITTPEDARRALDAGVDGVSVSNHGGRQLDGVPAAIQVLPDIVETVGDEVEVFMDGGIRRGTDVLKALALGARACFIGRPYLYGLAVGGAGGVIEVLDLLREEIDRGMALLGCADVRDLGPHHLAVEDCRGRIRPWDGVDQAVVTV